MTSAPGEFDGIGGAAAEAAHRKRACLRKDVYSSAKLARRAGRAKSRFYGKALRVYRCPFHQHFHLASLE